MTTIEKFSKFAPVVKKAYEDGKAINLEYLSQYVCLDRKDIISMEDEGLVVAKVAYQKETVTLFRVTKKGYLACV